jgi:hypothetical protein
MSGGLDVPRKDAPSCPAPGVRHEGGGHQTHSAAAGAVAGAPGGHAGGEMGRRASIRRWPMLVARPAAGSIAEAKKPSRGIFRGFGTCSSVHVPLHMCPPVHARQANHQHIQRRTEPSRSPPAGTHVLPSDY